MRIHKGRIRSIVFFTGFLLCFLSAGVLYSQDSLDDLFLDDSFSEEGTTEDIFSDDAELTDETIDETSDDDAQYTSPPEAKKQVFFSMQDSVSFATLRESAVHNKDALHYSSPWSNQLWFNNYARYVNPERYLEFKIDYNILYQAQSAKHTDSLDTLDTYFGYELRESMVRLSLFDTLISFRNGKLNRKFGTAFLYNPSNPLRRTYGSDILFAKNEGVQLFDTKNKNVSLDYTEKGTGDDVGFWATEIEVFLEPIVWRLAYLPKLETGFREFDRPDHSWLTSVNITAWDSFTPRGLFFLYGDNYFTGFDFSFGHWEQITLQAEVGISSENEQRVLKKDGTTTIPTGRTSSVSFPEWTLEPSATDGVFVSSVVGLVYTPSFDGTSYFSSLFEIYYNGKGLWNDEWETQLNYLNDIKQTRDDYNDQSSPFYALSDVYKGLHNVNRYYYDPLQARPLYLMMRIWRDDLLKAYWTETLNIETSLLYSVLDTSFLWDVQTEVITNEIMTIGVETRYAFGLPYGAFTELTEVFKTSVYTKVTF